MVDFTSLDGTATANCELDSYKNTAFSIAQKEYAGPYSTIDTRKLPPDITAQELGIILSMTIRLPAHWVKRDFAGAERFFTAEEPSA